MRYRPVDWEASPKGLNSQQEAQRGFYHYARPIPQGVPQPKIQQHTLTAMEMQKVCQIHRDKPVTNSLNPNDLVHLENMRHNLERRLQIALARGDKNLVNLLHHESRALSLI